MYELDEALAKLGAISELLYTRYEGVKYTTWDKQDKLGPRRPYNPVALANWERVHGHTVHVSCDRATCNLWLDPKDILNILEWD